VIGLEQRIDEVRPDEPRPAGDDDPHPTRLVAPPARASCRNVRRS
jgi:hypothetical protein